MNPPIVSPPSVDLSGYLVSFFHLVKENFPFFIKLLESTYAFLVVISIPIGVFFIIGIIISIERLKAIRAKEKLIYNTPVVQAYDEKAKGDPELAHRWKSVVEHVDSSNENDWRQAILEADIILEDILRKMGYQGDGVGEMLSRAERADFKSLNEAWEAHKVRNMIAHEGSAFALSQYEAKRVINLFRKVFEEFFYI
jgi:hypothetical protein